MTQKTFTQNYIQKANEKWSKRKPRKPRKRNSIKRQREKCSLIELGQILGVRGL